MSTFLGQLGKLFWWRCRYCGITFSTDSTEEDDDDGYSIESPDCVMCSARGRQ